MTGSAVTVRVPARAALAGNPSDGYGGAVLAVTVDGLAATAAVTRAGADALPPECHDLVAAALAAFRDLGEGRDVPVKVTVRSTIPREVGLAGSSAIVIAVLRALGALTGRPIPGDHLAAVALGVERDRLGIAAGPQDRVVQTRGGLVAMDFAGGGMGTSQTLEAAGLPPLLLGWLTAAGAASGVYHEGLRARASRDDDAVTAAMAALRGHGLAAARAARTGDHAALAAAMDGSYDARASLGGLDERHVALVEAARAAGFAVNYAGSGGAVVATGGTPAAFAGALAPLGAETIVLRPGSAQPS